MPFFDANQIRLGMAGAPLRTTKLRLSVPIVNRFVQMLEMGRVAPPILVARGLIVDGAYRYAAGWLLGRVPATRPAPDPGRDHLRFGFAQVIWEELDHEKAMKSDSFREREALLAAHTAPPPAPAVRARRSRAGASRRPPRSAP